MRKRLWDLAKSRIEIGTILPGHRHKVQPKAQGATERGGWSPVVVLRWCHVSAGSWSAQHQQNR